MNTVPTLKKKTFFYCVAAFSIVMLCSTCVTQDSKQGNVAQMTEKAKKECRSFSETGSRIQRRSICLTKEEWAIVDARQKEIDADQERDTDKFFRRSLEQSGQMSGSGLDNPNTPGT